MTMKIRAIAFLVTLALSAAVSGMPARAAAPKEAAGCDLKEPIARLAEVRATASSSTEELAVRKGLLKATMECNAREAASFAESVDALEESSRIAGILKERYAESLRRAAAFAAERASSTDALETVTSTKDAARELKAWRDDVYNPLSWEASQLIVLDRNMVLAESAGRRVEQLLERAKEAEEAGVEGADAVRDRLNEADDLVVGAQDDLTDALTTLRSDPATEQEEIASSQKDALDALARAYEILIDSNERLATPAPAAPGAE